jgi:hypothetical protein
MEQIVYIIGSNVATFILAWVVSRMVARHQLLEEQSQRDAEIAKTQAWVEYLKNLQGGTHE